MDTDKINWTNLTTRDIIERNRIFMDAASAMPQLRLGGLTVKINIFHDTISQRNLSTGFHYHPDYEMSFMTEGSMEYRFDHHIAMLDSESQNWVFIPAGVNHCRVVTSTPSLVTGYLFQILADDPARLEKLDRLAQERGYLLPCLERSRQLIAMIQDELENESPLRSEVLSLLLRQLMIEVLRNSFPELFLSIDRSAPNRYSLVDMMLSYVHEHLFSNIRLSELAAQFGISERHANRIFVKGRGIALGQYILERRLNIAATQLVVSTQSIKEIAGHLGFQNMSYFCRQFKRCYGVTPSEYRESGKKESAYVSSQPLYLSLQ